MFANKVVAIGLLSGGLDSILACRLIMNQGIKVKAVKFVTPFFGYELLENEQEYQAKVLDQYGIEVELKDVSKEYLKLLRKPVHGFGKNFNPCVDCKIFMLTKAREMLSDLGGQFLFTGEVIGQRPMSQRRDALRIIERDSGCEGILLRPLCAKNLNPIKAEEEGLVDRDRLLDFSGRTRKPQMNLAKEFGITDYPSPAGGCFLADPELGKRLARHYKAHDDVSVNDIRLILLGRQFRLPHGGWLTIGRNQQDNQRLEKLLQPSDLFLDTEDRPGPVGILRYSTEDLEREMAAGLIARYAKKDSSLSKEVVVSLKINDQEGKIIKAAPLADEDFEDWRL